MGTISALLKAVQSVNLTTEIPKIFAEEAPEAVKLNQEQLNKYSIDSKGIKLPLYDSLAYAKEKNRQNPVPGFMHPDYYKSGALYGGMYLKVIGSDFVMGSTDSKEKKIENIASKDGNFGKDIWGLTKENKAVYSDIVYVKIKRYISEKTGLRFT